MKKKTKQMVIILVLTTIFTMYLYGMATIYFPNPIHLGLGQYIDVGTGIIIIALFIFGIVISMNFKKRKR